MLGCSQRKVEPQLTPWGTAVDSVVVPSDEFDLDDIQRNGELIALTLTGPDSYYDYHGRHLGLQYMLAQRFADRLGVSLRMEVCRDSAEMQRRLDDDEADIICYGMTRDALGWRVAEGKDQLLGELVSWYSPAVVDEVIRRERFLLSGQSVSRRVYSPMKNRSAGIISDYDAYFQRYGMDIRWDWRLLAAQCYQESTFDPQARSWAGACGLMQIMPQTADHLGLARADLFNPERNIAAATRYLAELERAFSDIEPRAERQKFVLAAYNGGSYHVRDAMALTQKYGGNAHRWYDVEKYILLLAQPHYYNDPVVSNGYMRGSETADYVRRITERYNGYRGVKPTRTATMSSTPQKAKHERKKKYQN